MVKLANVTRGLPAPTTGSHGIPFFHAQFDQISGIGPMGGLTLQITESGDKWKKALAEEGVTQDPTTKLLLLPAEKLPAACQKYAGADCKVAGCIFPDVQEARERQELHIVCGDRQTVSQYQDMVDEAGLGVDIAV